MTNRHPNVLFKTTGLTRKRDITMLHKLLLTTALAIGLTSAAEARLQLTINASGSTFTCFDGQLGCDLSGGANNLLLVDQTVEIGRAHV